jgi:hypothetical protein
MAVEPLAVLLHLGQRLQPRTLIAGEAVQHVGHVEQCHVFSCDHGWILQHPPTKLPVRPTVTVDQPHVDF